MGRYLNTSLGFGMLLLLCGIHTASGQTANVQFIHNAPDPALWTMDLYVDGALLLNNIFFRHATAYTEYTAGVTYTIAIAPAISSGPDDAYATFDVTLEENKSYQLVVSGVVDPNQFAPNPDGLDTSLQLLIHDQARTTTGAGTTHVSFIQGVTDAPEIDILVPDLGGASLLGILGHPPQTYGGVAPMTIPVALQTGESTALDFVPFATPEVVLTARQIDLYAVETIGIGMLMSGFVDPAANQNGPILNVLAVYPDGTVEPLSPAFPITIREINAIPQENIDQLIAAGPTLTPSEIQTLTRSPFAEQDVRVTAIVLSSPLSSGLSRWYDERGGPGLIYYFVRDTTAHAMGVEGMGIQIVDGDYESTGSLALEIGDVVSIQARVIHFANALQLIPYRIFPEGTIVDFGFDASILDPVDATVSDLNVSFGGGTYQANWANFSNLNGQYVRLSNTHISNRTPGPRPDWTLTDGTAQVYTYDTSLRYRNDRGDYMPPFNVRTPEDGDFIPPPVGTAVDLVGFLHFRDFNDPYNIGRPANALLSISPMEDEDLTVHATGHLNTLLAGPYTENGQMNTDLLDAGILPLHQPYNTAPWGYTGTEQVPAPPPGMVDWVLVHLRTGDPAAPPMATAATRAALLMADGSIRDLDGESPVAFKGVPPGMYYVVIEHRNHLKVMSTTALDFTEGLGTFDFSTDAGQAYGTNAQRNLGDGAFGLWSGDANANGMVSAFDFLTAWLPQNGTAGYRSADFNLDASVTAFDFLQEWFVANGQASQVPD